jgi:succinate dehydrogenase / fumarate reductase, cytochrome b subunit
MTGSMADATPGARARPLSPHLQVWRWHVTLATSILHRLTGMALYAGALILAGWALALASGPVAYGDYVGLLGSLPGRIVLFGVTLSAFFHLATGVRHLVWDLGKGFAPATATATAWVSLVFAVAASIALWAWLAMAGGG